ncbi:MAG TPA: hypothetical protein VFX53_02695 [Pedococcus sp.]|nr:hypothetical protein [Pedococcus sp.]
MSTAQSPERVSGAVRATRGGADPHGPAHRLHEMVRFQHDLIDLEVLATFDVAQQALCDQG